MDLQQLTDTATRAALSAGEVIRKYLHTDVSVEEKKGGQSRASQVVTEVDRACEAAILSHLRPSCDEYDLALLSEETEDDGGRFEKDFFWCIDPLDGTLPFVQKRPGFSVSIALVGRDGAPHLGVVLDPTTGTLYHASRGGGAYKNGFPIEIKNTGEHLTYLTDKRLRDTPRAAEIEGLLRKTVERLGLRGVREIAGAGAVLNAILVLEHGPACLLKLPKKADGGGSVWDFAATACIYQELGLPATNLAGGRLDLNRRGGTFMNHEGVFFASFRMGD